LQGPQFVADANFPVLEHVRPQPAAVRERIEQRLGDDSFQIPAWLAQALPLAQHAADAEATSNQRVQPEVGGVRKQTPLEVLAEQPTTPRLTSLRPPARGARD